LAWRILGSKRLSLVTDTMAALGMPPGRHVLGDYDVIVDGGRARLADGTLAGSLVSLDTTLRNLIRFTGCSLGEALPTVTSTPATVLGMGSERGSIAPGQIADLVILTPELRVHTTIVAGRIAFQDQGD
jgi:N-acetylglucosamine-6-phosphate deacetylase